MPEHIACRKSNGVRITELKTGMFAVAARFGFREEPDVPAALALAQKLMIEPMLTTYFVAHSMIVDGPGELPRWRSA